MTQTFSLQAACTPQHVTNRELLFTRTPALKTTANESELNIVDNTVARSHCMTNYEETNWRHAEHKQDDSRKGSGQLAIGWMIWLRSIRGTWTEVTHPLCHDLLHQKQVRCTAHAPHHVHGWNVSTKDGSTAACHMCFTTMTCSLIIKWRLVNSQIIKLQIIKWRLVLDVSVSSTCCFAISHQIIKLRILKL